MSDLEIKVPNIGDFKDVEVIEVLVSKGQSVSKNHPLITIETLKTRVISPQGAIPHLFLKIGRAHV